MTKNKIKNLTIKSNCDNLPLDITIILPEEKIKGIVAISHGMSEHKERYYDFMNYLTNNGYITVINDHRGHGKSIIDENDFGYFNDSKAEYIVNDLHQIISYIKNMYPNYPVYLFGHSMGSMVASKYTKSYDQEIDKLILCGYPSKNNLAYLGLLIANLISLIKGEKYRSHLLDKLSFAKYNKTVTNPKTTFDWISSNSKTIEDYKNDPLCGFVFTINGFKNLFHLNIDIYNSKNWSLKNKKMPIHFIAGSDDPIIVSEKKWHQSIKFMKSLGYNNVSNKLYPNYRHELLNEVDNKTIYEDILNFLEK